MDEAQFLSTVQVQRLHHLAQVKGTCPSSLRLAHGFQGRTVPRPAYLLALADDIEELKNICTCGKKATMNIRVDEQGRRIKEGEQIAVLAATRVTARRAGAVSMPGYNA